MVSAVIDKKYVKAAPLYRIEQDLKRRGLNISRQDMAHWLIGCSNRYLSLLYDFLHEKIYEYHVLQADKRRQIRRVKELHVGLQNRCFLHGEANRPV